MDIIDTEAADRSINIWANAFRRQCEEQFPGQGDFILYCSISILYCDLFRMFDPELIQQISNTTLAAAQLPYRIVTPS
jgi:hypothetical protein